MAEVDFFGCESCAEDESKVLGISIIASKALEMEGVPSEDSTSEATYPITPEDTRYAEPSLDEATESVDLLLYPAVALDCNGSHRPCLDFEKSDLSTETRLESERGHGQPGSPNFRLEADRQIETEARISAINNTEHVPREDSAQAISSECAFHSSISEAAATSAFVNHPQSRSEEVRFEPGVKCSDVTRAVEILKTTYRLSDVTIRKNMITWSCWNIADVIRGPHKDTTWWNGRSLPRRKDAKSTELQDVIVEELSDDKEFRQEMTELCRRIDTRDRELELILDDILQVAKQSYSDPYAGPIEVLETPTTAKDRPVTSRTELISGQEQQQTTAVGSDENSTDALNKRRNPFARVMRAIRRRFSRRSQTRKYD